MYCKICGYEAHEGCCEGCIGHTTDGYCVTEGLLEAQNREVFEPLINLQSAPVPAAITGIANLALSPYSRSGVRGNDRSPVRAVGY
jgi:hypothetical protein